MANIHDLGFPFTSVAGDRQYTASEWREYFDALVTSGVVGDIENELQVMPQAVPNKTVYVDTGAIMIKGAMRSITSVVNLTLTDNTSGNPRIDRIVARINYTDRKIEFVVKQGTPGASPAAPSLTRNTTYWEMSLAQIALADGFSTIVEGNITDERLDEDLCGYFKYRAKPAWYPEGLVSVDAWMYTNFKDQLSASEIANIEANSSLMAIINSSELMKINNRIDANEYNDYLNWMRLYYNGQFSGPSAEGMKGVILDGFKDTNNVDTGLTDANVVTTLPGVIAGSTVADGKTIDNGGGTTTGQDVYGNTIRAQVFKAQHNGAVYKIGIRAYKSGSPSGNLVLELRNVVGGNPGTTVLASASVAASTLSTNNETSLTLSAEVPLIPGNLYAVVAKVPSGDASNKIKWYSSSIAAPSAEDNGLYSTDNGATWLNMTNLSGDYWTYVYQRAGYTSGDAHLYTTVKALGEDILELRAYITAKVPSGATFTVEASVDGGSHYEAMDLISSRSDPVTSGFTEYEYFLSPSYSGDDIKMKFRLASSDGVDVPILKRYGAYFN